MNENEIKNIVKSTVAKLRGEKKVTLESARLLASAVMKEAERVGVKAVVCVSDASGNPRLVESADGAYIASYDIAVNKAFTSTALKTSTKKLGKLAQPGAELYGIQFTNGGRIVIFGGGEPLVSHNGEIVGGLGVSGGTESEDTALAEFGKRYFEDKI